MTITVEDMDSRLLTIDQLRTTLSATEPLASVDITEETPASTSLIGWMPGALPKDLTAAIPDVEIRVGTAAYPATVGALLEIASAVGLNQAFAKDVPGAVLEPLLNWALANKLKDAKKLLISDDRALAVTRSGVMPYSNLQLLDVALDAAARAYGASDDDLRVDYKLTHNLRQTHMRIIVPEQIRAIDTERATGNKQDNWSAGIQIRNSLTGAEQTRIDGYLFAWWCTNGCTNTYAESATWSRRRGSTSEELFEWARAAVDDVLGGLEHTFDNIQALTTQTITGEANDVLNDVFTRFRVAPATRTRIVDRMVENDDLTMYGVMQAITEAANGPDMSPNQITQLMELGGTIPSVYRDVHTVLELPDDIIVDSGPQQISFGESTEAVEVVARRVRGS